jgi:hypothetical protein
MDIFQRAKNRSQAVNSEPVGGGVSIPVARERGGAPARLRGLTYPGRVTNVNSEVLAPDFDRRFLFVQNNDPAGNVWISFGAPAVLGVGMKLGAGGGGILLDNNVPTSQLNAIGSIALNTNLTIITG